MARNGHGNPRPVAAYSALSASPPAKKAPTYPAARTARNGRTSVEPAPFSLCPRCPAPSLELPTHRRPQLHSPRPTDLEDLHDRPLPQPVATGIGDERPAVFS